MRETKKEKFKNLFEYYGFTKKDEKKYPVISRILKKLTPERIKKEIEAIQAIKLPPELQKWVREYEKVGERDEFFWKWLYGANQIIVFPSVPKQYQKSLRKIKVLFNMFLTLLDDPADKSSNKKLLNELLKIPFNKNYIKFNNLNQKEKKYLKFTIKLWNYIKTKMRKYPKYKEFKNIFDYDVVQLLNAMKYAWLVNKNPYLINETEYRIYLSHNMQAIIDLDFDLMCLPEFNLKKLGIFRKIAWEAQNMARIGNWISTWKREVKENDFTSGVFAYGIDKGIINPEQLVKKKNIEQIIKQMEESNAESYFLKGWMKSYKKIKNLGPQIKSINIEIFLSELERLLFLHLISQGYK